MGFLLRSVLLLACAAVGLLLALEVQAHRRSRRRPVDEIERALTETAASAPAAPAPASAPAPAPRPATRATPSGTTPLGIAAALVAVALTGWVLYRLSA